MTKTPSPHFIDVVAYRNPLFPSLGVNDPHMRVFNGKVYLYASHDADPDGYDFCMHDWHVWSTEDMITWHHETTLRPEDTFMGPSHECWALDAASKNGKYYVYFSECAWQTGVFIGDAPGGPFKDALGKPLLPRDLTPTQSYDPSVFIDDDGTPYIIFGLEFNGGYHIAKLNDDMISLAETPRKIELDQRADDKPDLFKHNGTYYLMWQSFYATSDSVYGPFKYRGNAGVAIEHGNVFEWNNQWFHAYGVQDPTPTYRSCALGYVHFKHNGEMFDDPLCIEHGVGHYDAGWNRIYARNYMASHNCRKEENVRNGFDIIAEKDSAWIKYPHVRNMKANSGMSILAANTNAQLTTIEIRKDAPDGMLLGSLDVPGTHEPLLSEWQYYKLMNMQLCNAPGEHDIVFVIKAPPPDQHADLVKIDWFRFW